MIKQMIKVLNENDLKFNRTTIDVNSKKSNVIIIDLDLAEDNQPKDVVRIMIWINDNTKIKVLNITAHEVLHIPSEQRDKIKNVLLDFNTSNIIGAFGIKMRSREVDFTFSEVLSVKENGEAFEINRIPLYLALIKIVIKELKNRIGELEN